ncbi:hypothetical protein Acr_24g0002900 [Actinidia rufa]|uniref:Xylanase inhibitor C-terminal domain-containing protein n=1 Tax=Actinidia rufa TaxID=165716 RepID=A0A7J0GTE3_9ERIC|nr:hypothetical protein Acr_24g0002900 [Actinidia rufa]
MRGRCSTICQREDKVVVSRVGHRARFGDWVHGCDRASVGFWGGGGGGGRTEKKGKTEPRCRRAMCRVREGVVGESSFAMRMGRLGTYEAVAETFGMELKAINVAKVAPAIPFSDCFSTEFLGYSRLGLCVDGGLNPRTSIVTGAHQLEDNLLQFDLAASKLGFTSTILQQELSEEIIMIFFTLPWPLHIFNSSLSRSPHFYHFSLYIPTSPPKPKSLLLPVTKDPSTLQYLTQLKPRNPSHTKNPSPRTRRPPPMAALPGCNKYICSIALENTLTQTVRYFEVSTDAILIQSTIVSNFIFGCSDTWLLKGLRSGAEGMACLARKGLHWPLTPSFLQVWWNPAA